MYGIRGKLSYVIMKRKEDTMTISEVKKQLPLFEQELEQQEYSPITSKKYVKDVERMLRLIKAEKIDKSTLQTYKNHIMERYKPNTVNSYIMSVNTFMKWAGREDLTLRTIRIQKNTSMENVLSREEYETMLEVAKENKSMRNYMILKVLAMTGMRVGELQYLTVEALEQGTILVKKKGKYREVYLQESLIHLLKEYCEKEGITSGYLFFGRKKEKPLDTTGIWKLLKNIAKLGGVDADKVYPHSFRHLFAKIYMEEVGNVLELADILGHSNVETTRRYTLTTVKEKKEALERLNL